VKTLSKEEKMGFAHNALQETLEAKVKLEKALVLSTNNVVGKWINCDKQTRGLVSIMISAQGTGLKVQCFGACTPTACDWGAVAGIAYAENVSGTVAIAFSAMYDLKFKATIVTGYLDHGCLIVETFDTFKDGSGRSNYYSRYYMCKA
jgi:hypothetical protein